METTTRSIRQSPRDETFRRGSVLVVVLWVIFGLVSVTLYFAHSMALDLRAEDSRNAGVEADLAIEGARRYLSCLVSNLNTAGAMPDPLAYQAEAVPVGNAHYWLIGRTNDGNPITPGSPLTFGLVDEASKINLNVANSNMLILLPRMTPQLVADLLAWRSTNTSSTAGGAESDTYMRLQPPYLCKNSPFETLDELRLVNNMTRDILYGEDANLNGGLDLNENDGDATPPSDDQNGQLDPGLFEYLTVYSREPANTTNGVARFNVAAYSPATSGQLLRALTNYTTITTSRAQAIIAQVNRASRGASIGSPIQFYQLSGMSAAEFEQVEPNLRGPRVTGLVNVNTAGVMVLSCLPNMTTGTAQQLVSYRQSNRSDQNSLTSVAWVTGVLDAQTAAAIGPWITGRTYQLMADVAALGHNGRGYRRTRFIFDTHTGTTKILYRQDLSYLGWALGKDVRDKYLLAKATP